MEQIRKKKIRMFATKPKMASPEPCNTPEKIRIMEELNDIGRQFVQDSLDNGTVEFDTFALEDLFMEFCIRPENTAAALSICHQINEIVLSFVDDFNEAFYEKNRQTN